jgi:hypothetical protein
LPRTRGNSSAVLYFFGPRERLADCSVQRRGMSRAAASGTLARGASMRATQVAIVLVALTASILAGCSLLVHQVESWCVDGEDSSTGFPLGSHVRLDSTGWTLLHSPDDPANPCVDAGTLLDAGADAGMDAGASDSGPVDAATSCLLDPPPEGQGACTRNEDCARPCSPNVPVHGLAGSSEGAGRPWCMA